MALLTDLLTLLLPVAAVATDERSSAPLTGRATATVTVAGGGGTILLQETFENTAFAARGWYDNTAYSITTAEHIPGSTSALQIHYPVGGGYLGAAMRHSFTATPSVYISYWVKYSDNWVGSGRLSHPHEYEILSDMDGATSALSQTWLGLYLEQNYQNGGIPRMSIQDNNEITTSYGTPPINLIGVTENRSTCGCNGQLETTSSVGGSHLVWSCYNAPPWYNAKEINANQVWFQPTPGPGYKGNWNYIEAYYQLNSIVGGVAQDDGVMQYWFNGTLAIDRHDIQYRTSARPNIQFNQFDITPYIGGSGSPVDQYMWVDNLTVATARP